MVACCEYFGHRNDTMCTSGRTQFTHFRFRFETFIQYPPRERFGRTNPSSRDITSRSINLTESGTLTMGETVPDKKEQPGKSQVPPAEANFHQHREKPAYLDHPRNQY